MFVPLYYAKFSDFEDTDRREKWRKASHNYRRYQVLRPQSRLWQYRPVKPESFSPYYGAENGSGYESTRWNPTSQKSAQRWKRLYSYAEKHDELLAKLQKKQDEVTNLLARADTFATQNPGDRDQSVEVYAAMAESLGEAWKDLNAKLEYRTQLLDESISFYQSAGDFAKRMEQARAGFSALPLASDVETAKRLLQQHQDMKKGILESSKSTLDLGYRLLDRIKELGVHADAQNRHATTAACYGIEHLLELLHDRRRHLEDLWLQRKLRLEQCLQLCQLDQEVNKALDWFRTVGSSYLKRSELGDSTNSSQALQQDHNRFEQQAREIQETVLRLMKTVEQLLHRGNLDAEGVRQRLSLVDRECEDFMIKLDNRRKNLSLSLSFFQQAETALTQMEQIRVRLNSTDLPRNSAALVDLHQQLSDAISQVSTPALHTGQSLLERVGRGDQGADGVRRKLAELQERCTELEALCKARGAEARERSQAYLQFQERYTNLNTWLTQIGQATLSRHADMGNSLASSKDFLEVHEQLDEDIRDKSGALSALSESVVGLVKSGDQEAPAAAQKVDMLSKQWQRMQRVTETRIKLSLLYVSFHKLANQLAINLDGLEAVLRTEREDLQELPEAAVQHTMESWNTACQLFQDMEEKAKAFLQNSSTVTDDSTLEVKQSVRLVEQRLLQLQDRMASLRTQWESWQQRVSSSRQFKVQWHQFVQDARKTIDWAMKTENEFFPVIIGELGSSLETAQKYQARLDVFLPICKKVTEEIEKHLKTAEMLGFKGDTKGQKDQIVNELVRVHQRFQARIHEYQLLLKMTIQFFQNLHQVDKLIEKTEKEYMSAPLPQELNRAEQMLENHHRKKHEVAQMIKFTADEGDQIVTRVRQQNAEAAAQDEVQKVLNMADEYKKRWNNSWEEQERRLQQNLQICQFNFDLRQIHSEIDELHRQLQLRHGNYGNSLQAAKMTSQAFKQYEMTIELIEKKIENFIATAELMVKEQHYDSANIQREIDELKNKWSTFHTSVRDYRKLLEDSVTYYRLIEESEEWTQQGNQLLLQVGRQFSECQSPEEAEEMLRKVKNFVEAGKPAQDERLQKISVLADKLYGDQGPSRIQHLVLHYQELLKSFRLADEEIGTLRDRLSGKDVPMEVSDPMERKAKFAEEAPRPKPPRILQHLQNAEVLEGTKFTFECRIEVTPQPVEVKWFKDNLPLNSPDYETKFFDGLATLTIEETFSEDTARYTCRFNNAAGTAESSAHLHVKETHQQIVPPDFTKNLKSVDVIEGAPFMFECHVTGIPSPTISWYKDEQNIDNSPDFVITKINGTNCLKIRSVAPSHGARYTCRADNPGGEAASSARLNVITMIKPTIQEPLKDVAVPEGKAVLLQARYSGSPQPDIHWYRGNDRIIPSAVFKITTEPTTTVLEITEAFPEDTAVYTVQAINPAGEATSSCQVNVESFYSSTGEDISQGSTDVEPVKPMFMQKLALSKQAPERSRVRLDCVIVGHPEPEVIWYHNGQPVKESKDMQLLFEGDRCTLVIREILPEDAGEYKCVARNIQGEAESACILHVEPATEPSDFSTVSSRQPMVAPKFTSPLRDANVSAGQPVYHGVPCDWST
ncbi:coiled-coil domain-containing protein 141-like isoform X2 [Liolophura sinensis]|uniref:coiled-coil domain-containing protein 141-like isoform X2 n=1 Tax=Liolophura sinensis TaxID=3198878 RepID=UPI003158002C